MEVDSEMAEGVGRRRETSNGTEVAEGGRRTSRKITRPKYGCLAVMDAQAKRMQDNLMKRLVARWNAENPDATPLVLEALTEQQRATLKREDLAREVLIGKAYVARMIEEDARAEVEERDPNQDDDDRYYQGYRERWDMKYAKEFGSFEDKTRIPAMCFTDDPMFRITDTLSTMQIFSVKVEQVYGNLRWPLDVFGIVAVRDDLDLNRNMIFERKRDNCQTLQEQDPYLELTGPVRAPITQFGPIRFDVMLKVKRTDESEDEDLSLIGTRYRCCESINYQAADGECALRSCVSSQKFKSKLSTLELTCGKVVSSVEATISVRVVEGSWPDGFSGRFTASTASVSHMKVLLLNFCDGNVPVSAADGTVVLARRVVSVESSGELRICAAAWRGREQVNREVFFQPLKSGRSSGLFNVSSCKLEVTVAWSLFPIGYPTARISSTKDVLG